MSSVDIGAPMGAAPGAPVMAEAGVSEIAQAARARKLANRRANRTVLGIQLALVVVLGISWEICSKRYDLEFWVSRPSLVWERFQTWWESGLLWRGLKVTMHATIVGFVIGATLGAFVGFLMGWIRLLGRVFEPFVFALYTLPKIALAPLFVLWFGIGLKPKIVLAAVLVFFLVFFTTYQGAKAADRTMIEMANLMGGRRFAVLRKVIVPTSAVWVFSGLKIALPYALIGAVVGEFIASTEGLGFMIKNATTLLDTSGVFAGLVILMVLATLLTQLLRLVERYVLRWQQPT